MKIQRLAFISTVALAVVAMFSLTPVYAQLTLASWGDTWHKVTFKGKGPCSSSESPQMNMNAESFPGYIYLVSGDDNAGSISAVVLIELYEDEWKGARATFNLELGTGSDGVFQTATPIEIDLQEGYFDTYTLSFYFRLLGKVTKGQLTGNITSMSGHFVNDPTDGDGKCFWNLTFSGKRVNVINVPASAQAEVNYLRR
jgi:hypothetical protein